MLAVTGLAMSRFVHNLHYEPIPGVLGAVPPQNMSGYCSTSKLKTGMPSGCGSHCEVKTTALLPFTSRNESPVPRAPAFTNPFRQLRKDAWP